MEHLIGGRRVVPKYDSKRGHSKKDEVSFTKFGQQLTTNDVKLNKNKF